MKVILAGYNIDSDVIADLKRHAPARDDITPETLSASYARISRDPRPIDELRAAARQEVEKARRSNQTIIFKMGHHSVAEHAVFNFDLIGLSRLALEEVEKFRLCSFTEKSQRYIALGDDFVIPEEIRQAGMEAVFLRTIRTQNSLYHSLYERLKAYVFDKQRDIAQDAKNHSVLDGWAKEDARYTVSLATQGQVGMTINARNLELLIRRFAAKKLAELRELNAKIYALAKEVAPSIILFTEPSEFDSKTYADLEEAAQRLHPPKQNNLSRPADGRWAVRLVGYTPDGDDRILAALLHTVTARSYESCYGQVRGMSQAEKSEFIRSSLQHMEFHDFPLREFEHADLTFELIVSAACFAQLKRHRMATLTRQRYAPELGVTIPPSVEDIGAAGEFLSVIEQTNDAYARLKREVGEAADYVLTNAHRRRALLRVNIRELYHISRLRQDATAQWDIKRIVGIMTDEAGEVMPLSLMLLGGKDRFPQVYKKVFGRDPKTFPPDFLK
jgi:flavin-dependent thymidylate synthase